MKYTSSSQTLSVTTLPSALVGGTVGSGSGVFVSKKISKIRWRPRSDTSTLIGKLFVTGSWDDDQNEVMLWEDGAISASGSQPIQLMTLPHLGDVNDLEFLNPDIFCTASSVGSVNLFRLIRDGGSKWKMVIQHSWDKLHRGNGNSVSCNGENVATGGEDGRIFLLNVHQKRTPLRTIEHADSCSLTAISFIKHDEVISANMRGQMKLWDLRSKSTSSTLFLSNKDQIGITCISRHPTQSHVLCTGGQDGMLAIWDLRSERHPVTLLKAHDQAVSEVQFHEQHPDHIFSCSQNGDIWHWDASTVTRASLLNYGNQQQSNTTITEALTTSPWLSSEAVKHRVETHSLMSKQSLPINSLDSLGSSIIYGGDNEAIYLIPSVIL